MIFERGSLIVILSFFFAFVLVFISLPDFLPDYISYARPNWVALVLIYWIIFIPHRIGLITAWVSGLIVDVLQGGLLGQHALAYLLIGYIIANLYQRMKMFSIWQQAMIIFITMLAGELILYLINLVALGTDWTYMFLLPPLLSALLWPWISILLKLMRGQFRAY